MKENPSNQGLDLISHTNKHISQIKVNSNYNRQYNLKNIYFLNRDDYIKWLDKTKISKGYKRDVLSPIDKLFKTKISTENDLLLYSNNNELSKYLVLAIRKWLVFCEDKELLYEEFIRKLKKKIKVTKCNKINPFVPSEIEISQLLDKTKHYCILSYIFERLLLDSGLRITEVQYFISEYEKFNPEKFEKIVIIPLFHLRGNKNTYYMFLKKETFELWNNYKEKLKNYNVEKLKTWIKRNKLVRLKYTRKYNFTKLIRNNVNFEISNFIQGRVSTNIGFNHYSQKKEIAIKEYEKIL